MNVKKGSYRLIVVLVLLLLLSISVEANDYSVRSELCYQHEVGTTWDNFANNLYVSGFVDYELYENDPWDFSFYVTPKVVYNMNEGLDLYLGFRVNFLVLES